MSFSKNGLISMGFCLLSSALTACAVAGFYHLYPSEKVVEVESNAMGNVVYCIRDIPANTPITRADLFVRRMPVLKLPANPCDCIYSVLGRKLKYPLRKGDALSPNDFGLLNKLNSSSLEKEPPRIFDEEGVLEIRKRVNAQRSE